MQVIAITKDGSAARIGNTFAQSTWYILKKVKDVEIKKGDLVELKFEKEGTDNVITELKVSGNTPLPSGTSTEKAPWRSKSIEESESIRRQAVGKMVAETMKALNIESVKLPHPWEDVDKLIRALFNTYDELTK